jgi:hypothetical protein
MAVAIPNFEHSYLRKGKPVFVPTVIGRRIGNELKNAIEATYKFNPVYFHFRPGGHVAAMHLHRDNAYFACIDISKFFYSITRRRVQSALDRIGVIKARFYSKWSTVSSPYCKSKYVLPYGFVQSPIVSTLVMATSNFGNHILCLPKTIKVSIYMDDILLSSNNIEELQMAFTSTCAILGADGFQVNFAKLSAPILKINIFNCDLEQGRSVVCESRKFDFFANCTDKLSENAFIEYCNYVEMGNSA